MPILINGEKGSLSLYMIESLLQAVSQKVCGPDEEVHALNDQVIKNVRTGTIRNLIFFGLGVNKNSHAGFQSQNSFGMNREIVTSAHE